MQSWSVLIILAIYVSFIDGQLLFFRDDYTYNNEVRGWTRLNLMPEKWEEARLRCHLEGSTLATPIDDDYTSIMLDTMGQRDVKMIFLGMSAIYSEGDFFSVEGYPLKKLSNTWAPGEPNNPGDERCIAMYNDGSLADVSCTKPLPYMCFRKESGRPSINSPCGNVDQEYTYESTGHCYKVHPFGQTWSKAFMACSAEGGYLTIINSDQEREVLRNLIGKYHSDRIHAQNRDSFAVGLRDWSEHGVFRTIHGETLQEAGFDRWAHGEPNNANDGEYCGGVHRDGQLNDISCAQTFPFICEMVPWSLNGFEFRNLEDVIIPESPAMV